LGRLPPLLVWGTHEDASLCVQECGALREIESALHEAYRSTAESPIGRLKRSRAVETELFKAGWKKTRVWAPEGFTTGDSFDGWKLFSDPRSGSFGVAVEIQWTWPGIYSDLLKFWRAARGGQAAVGVEVLRGPDAFNYVINHVFALYRELIPDLRVREQFPGTTTIQETYAQ
jgi:hypothetical protein